MVMKMKVPRFATALAATSFLAAACSPIRTVTPVPPAAIGGASETAPASPGSQPAQPNPPAGQGPILNSGPVSLRVDSPQEDATVNAPQIQVSGMASPGAVVTVNDIILIAGADGRFTATVPLDEGPNLIEVIASNDSGDEKAIELTVIYEP